MKTRYGFVSNSSSSSFVISLDDISAKQLRQILNNPTTNPDHWDFGSWTILLDDEYIRGITSMDNFDFFQYLVDDVKVDPQSIDYERI